MRGVWQVLALTIFASPASANDERPYSPSPFSSCEDGAGLSTATSDVCLSITGRVLWAYQGSVVDGRLSLIQSNLFFGASSQTENGPVRIVIGLEGWDGHDIEWQNNWAWITRSDVRLTDAVVSFGDEVKLTAGARDRRWGSVVDMAKSETYWTGDIAQTGQIFLTPLFGWAHGPELGGHVVQIEANVGNGFSLVGAVESLNKIGNAVAMARYDSETLNAYAGIMTTGFLGPNVQTTAFNTGVRASFGDTQVLAHATGAWQGSTSRWTASGQIDQAIGSGGLVGIISAFGADDPTYPCWGACPGNPWERLVAVAGITAYLDLSSIVRFELGGQYGADKNPGGHQDFRTLSAKVTLAPLETLELSAGVGAIWQSNSSTLFSGSWDDTYVDGQVMWTPGGGLRASAKGRHQGNGAYTYTLKAEKRF